MGMTPDLTPRLDICMMGVGKGELLVFIQSSSQTLTPPGVNEDLPDSFQIS